MALNLREGTGLIKDSAEGKGIKRFTPNIYWAKSGDLKAVAFITEADKIVKAKLHQFVQIPDDKLERGYRNEMFLCKKDPAMLDYSNGKCPLCDVIGHNATERFVSVGVELDVIRDGKRPKEIKIKYRTVEKDDGTEKEYPVWGMIIQASPNFYSYLAAYEESQGDIRERGFEIMRDGEGIKTKYHFMPIMAELPDLSELVDELSPVDILLEEVSTDEHYAQLSGVKPGSQPVFGPRKDQSNNLSSVDEDALAEFERIRNEVEAY